MQFRSATPDDVEAVRAIYAPFVEHTTVTFETVVPSIEELERRRQRLSAHAPFLVADDDGEVVGFAYAGPHRSRAAYQWSVESSIYIAPPAHRRGIARAMYGALLKLLDTQGFAQVYAGITLPNVASEHFHAALGFMPIGVYPRVGFKAGAWRDVSWSGLALSASREVDPAPPAAPATVLSTSAGLRLLTDAAAEVRASAD